MRMTRCWAGRPYVALLWLGLLCCVAVEARAEWRPEVTVVKREVVEWEPILVRLDMLNDGREREFVAPPYMDYLGRWGRAIDEIIVRSESGAPIAYMTTPAETAEGAPWRHPVGHGYEFNGRLRWSRSLCPYVPWVIPGGSSVYTYVDLSCSWESLPPGRYYIELHYSATREMLDDVPGQPSPQDCWEGERTISLGWISVLPATGRDAEVAALIAESVDERHPFAFRSSIHEELRERIRTEYADTTYGPYAAYGRITELVYRRLGRGLGPGGAEPVIQEFLRAYPDFALNYQWPVWIELARVWPTHKALATADELAAAFEPVLREARAAADLRLVDEMERTLESRQVALQAQGDQQ